MVSGLTVLLLNVYFVYFCLFLKVFLLCLPVYSLFQVLLVHSVNVEGFCGCCFFGGLHAL